MEMFFSGPAAAGLGQAEEGTIYFSL